ncbi:MAG TPA: hypothetical protein DCG06_00525 [Deltaproteobacteria bacterium]|nr:hypothetical protein [Deltaproteobacteria bacterium]
MTGQSKHLQFLAICAASVALVFPQPCPAQEKAAGLPEKEIAALQKELIEAGKASSSTRKRRAYKNVVRDGEGLVKKSSAATSRFRVLEIIFQSQKRLLALENSDRNREALFVTGSRLVEAPNELADLRLEADLLLSERDLSAKNAEVKERAETLEGLVARYRGTSGEAKSLMMAAQIAPKLQAFELQKRILDALGERFAGDMEVIEFRRKHLGLGRMEVLFKGVFMRSDGVTLRFPADLMGRQSLMVFWSQKTPGFEDYLKMIKEQEDQFPGQFEVFSFNVDELPDAGESTLKSLGLTWTVMRLPGGKKSQTYRAYVVNDPVGVFVNAYGYALLAPNLLNAAEQAKLGVRGAPLVMSTLNRRLDNARFLSQLQSLLIGDVLVAEPGVKLDGTVGSVPAETLQAIQKFFPPAPFRYRLSATEALANYKKAEKLCGEAAGKHPGAPNFWMVRNRRIIALLGMWNLAGEPRYLEQAAEEARTALAAKLAPRADIVPRFCLAKEALRDPEAEPGKVIGDFVESQGGEQASGPVLAAAALLSLDVADCERYGAYRELILKRYANHAMMWTFTSFLLDRYHRYWLFRVPFVAGWTYGRRQQWDLSRGYQDEVERHVKAELHTLDGKPYLLPDDSKGKWTAVLFTNSWVDDKRARLPSTVTRYLNPYIEKRGRDDLRVIVAVLDGEVAPIQKYLKEKPLNCEVLTVPGGVSNPLVRQLGILDEDIGTNALILRPDGSVAASLSEMTMTRSKHELIPNIISWSDEEAVMALLEKGEIEKAKDYIFTVAPPFDPKAVDGKGRPLKKPVEKYVHLRARAYVYLALGDKKAALNDAEEVLQFLKAKAGWMTLLPKGLEEAEELVELLKKKGEE